jgi:uncharacterized protein (TIGR02757 family)
MDKLIDFLENKVLAYNQPSFIDGDPISVPHRFSGKNDIEIAAFFSAILAWGNRKSIVKSANELMNRMDQAPFDFLMNASEHEHVRFHDFIYRTFQGDDCLFFLHSLRNIYNQHGGLQHAFSAGYKVHQNIKGAIMHFRNLFFEPISMQRTQKYIANPISGSAAKRINMFLRWMVRKDSSGVDFGIWDSIPPSDLMCPLDVHSGRVARKLGLLSRKLDDWKSVEELTENLRKFDPSDPVKYDYALFGLGVFEKF